MWMFQSWELFTYWLGLSGGRGISTVGEKVADKAIPFGRPTARDKRRTGRILKGDMAELHDLYSRLCQYEAQAEETIDNLSWRAVGKLTIQIPKLLENPLLNDAQELCRKLLEFEGYAPIPEIDFTRQLPLGEIWGLKKTVQRYLVFYESQKRQEEIADILMLFLYNLFHKDVLPDAVFDGKTEEMAFSVPLYNFYTDTAQAIEFGVQVLSSEHRRMTARLAAL